MKISDITDRVSKWDPRKDAADRVISYIDLSSVDKDHKRINDDDIAIIEGKDAPSRARQIVKQNDILVSTVRPNLNGVAIVEKEYENATASTGYSVLRCKSNGYYKYLYYWTLTSTFVEDMTNKSSGASYPAVSDKIIKDSKIPLPPLAQQKKIAAILDAADAYRQKTKALIAKYDELTQSLFLEMFGDPVRNEKGWEKVKFSEVGKLDRGKSKHRPRNAPELLGGEHPLIQTGDLANCGIYLTKYKSTYSDIGLMQSKKWPKGTLCITIAANIAKTGILDFDACFPDSVVGFVPNEKSNNVYVLFWMSFLQKILEDSAPESAQKNINLAILRDLDFLNVPIDLQNQFAERVQKIEGQKAQAQESLEKAEELFNSLLQRAFKEELV